MGSSGSLQFTRGYQGRTAYRQSKLAMLMFGLELDRRLRASGSAIRSIPAHPGIARTDIARRGERASPVQRLAGRTALGLFGQSAARGALPLVHAAASPEAEGGVYYGPNGFQEARGRPGIAKIAPHALDRAEARRLWSVSEALTGVTWLS